MGTKGGIWLMEVIFEELKVPPRAGLEVELGTFVPPAARIGHHHQEKTLKPKVLFVTFYLVPPHPCPLP